MTCVNALYMAAWPLALFWLSRQWGFSPSAAAATSLLTTIVDADKGDKFKHLFGLHLRCFSWGGWGLYTQIVAAVWMCIALGKSHQYLNTGRGFALASVAVALCWLSHLIVGYGVSLLTVVLVLAQPPSGYRVPFVRLIAVNAVAACLILYQVVPTLLEKHILNRSVFEPAAYWDSYGLSQVTSFFWQGRLLDSIADTWPWVTYLVLASLCYLAVSYRRVVQDLSLRQALLCFVSAFLLFSGRSTFGPLAGLLPFSYNLPFHRFFVHFQLFALLLGGWVLGEIHGSG